MSQFQETQYGGAISVVSQRQAGELTGVSLGSTLEILERIGRGGMGSVYLARHRDWNLSLAVKWPRPDLLSSDVDKERWLLEAQTWIDLGVHPNIVRCWFIREHQGIPLLFLDYVAGGSLKEAIEQQRYGVANWPKFLDLAIQACDGLEHAHRSGIVHRDVKPANFLLDDDGRLYVTDFGLVKLQGSVEERRTELNLAGRDTSLTSTGTVLGTPNYCAPEQWLQEDVGVPADLYAMGVVLYEMSTGQLPFEAGAGPLGLGQLLSQVISEEPVPPSQLQPAIPDRLEKIILRLLSKEASARHATAWELREDLVSVYQEVTGKSYPRPVPKPVEAVVDVLNNKAVSLYSLGRKKPAEQTWQQALKLDSLHPDVVFNRGWLLWKLGRHSAQELTSMLRQVKVTYRRGAVHCGLAHLLGGEWEQAEQNFQAALGEREAAQDSSVWRHLGDARMGQERFPEAVAAYRKALTLNPGDQEAQRHLGMAEKKSRRRSDGRCLFPRSGPLLRIERQHRLTGVQVAAGGWLWLGPEQMELLPADKSRRSWSECHDVGLRRVAVSASADRIVAIGSLPAGVWDLTHGELISTLGEGERHFCLSPDGLSSVVGLVDVRLQSLVDGSCGRTLRGHERQVLCATFIGPGRLLTGSCDRTMRCWDTEKALCLKVFQGHKDHVTCVGYSPESGLAITGSKDGTARTWRVDTGEPFGRVLDNEGQMVSEVHLACQGAFAVLQWFGEESPWTSVWDLRSGEAPRRISGFSRVSPDGEYLATGRGNVVEIREIRTGCLRRTLAVADKQDASRTGVADICFSEDGRFVAVVTSGGIFSLFEFDEATRVLPQELLLTYTRGGQDLEESRELFLRLLKKAEDEFEAGSYIAARSSLQQAREVPGYRRDPQARALTRLLGQYLGRGGLLSCWEARLLGSAGGSAECPVVILPGGDRLLTGNEKILRLWDAQQGNCIRGFPGHSETIRAIDVNAEGTMAVSGSLDRGVRCWDLETGECVRRVACSRGGVTALSYVADSPVVVALTNQYSLCGIDFDASQEVYQVPATGLTWMVSLGKQMWLGGPMLPGKLQVVEAVTGQVVRKANQWKLPADAGEGALLATAGVAYGGGRFGISAAPDGRLHLWDLQEGRHLTVLLDAQSRVSCLAISSDGLCLAVGLENGWVQLWDLEKRVLCQVLEGPWGRLAGLGMAADGCELYILGSDQVLRVWEMEWELLESTQRRQLADTLPKAGLLGRLWRGLRG